MSEELTLISAATVARLKNGSVLQVRSPYIVTPSAAELAERKEVRIEETGGAPADEPAPNDTSLAPYIDSTLLTSEATPGEIETLCEEAATRGFAAVCVNPIYVTHSVARLSDTRIAICTVCGFPLGAAEAAIKAAEARLAIDRGATEIDMVLPVGLLRAGELGRVRDDITAVRQAMGASATLKVIMEAPLLTEEQKVTAAVISVEAGADFVKTGTGFAGPASVADVRLIRQAVGDRARIKAAGGIRDRQSALALIAAGADRIGTSRAAAVIGLDPAEE